MGLYDLVLLLTKLYPFPLLAPVARMNPDWPKPVSTF